MPKYLLSLIFLSGLVWCSCKPAPVSGSVDVVEFNTKRLNSPDAIILDIRSPEEYAEGYIPGAVFLDYNDENFEGKLGAMDTTKLYMVYCQGGSRSKPAFEWMTSHGFSNVVELNGGFDEWQKAGMEVAKDPQ